MSTNYLELCDFNFDIYKIDRDLQAMSNEELEYHFMNYGIKEGRFYNTVTNRKSFVELIPKKGRMLEIGPLDNPQLNFNSPDYYSIDVFTKAQLIENYKDDSNVNKDKIIEPSFIVVNNDYSPIQHKFRTIFSSHNIEHMPCVVTFLNNLEQLLDDDGCIYFVIPDKRYCFDYYKKETDIYDVLQLFYEKNSRPRLMDVLKMKTQSTHNDSYAHWSSDNHGIDHSEASLVQLYEPILRQYNTGVYIDAHVSTFTPHSFMKIIGMLSKLKLINLEVHKLYHTLRGATEFYAILKKSTP